jgi:hypothetical protein
MQLTSFEEWTNFQECWQKLPFDFGGIDGTSTEIYRPGIEPQEHYYSGNRHYHCIHTQVMITNDGEFEYHLTCCLYFSLYTELHQCISVGTLISKSADSICYDEYDLNHKTKTITLFLSDSV